MGDKSLRLYLQNYTANEDWGLFAKFIRTENVMQF